MERQVRIALSLAAVAIIAACAEGPTSASPRVIPASGARPVVIEPGTCTTITALQAVAADLFGAGSPDYNSVRGKLDNLAHQVELGNTVDSKGKAHDIVDFVLRKNEENTLPGEEYLVTFVNGVYCFAGLDITLTDPDNSELIFPTDSAQVVTSADGQAGIRFNAFPVNAPTLITFVAETSPPLNTKLDQYPGFFSITAQADAEIILTQPATVGVCAQGVIPADVRARLRLGHGLLEAPEAATYDGFEITPPAVADFITCANQVAVAPSSVGSRFLARVASLVLPAKVLAFQDQSFGGGVGGTVTEFSPFAPVDPQLEFGGGVGGTVTEFTRAELLLSGVGGRALAISGPCASPAEGAVGSPLRDECLPFVRVRTRLGTPFVGVPVQWAVTAGGGTIGARSETCGALAATAADVTNGVGISDICWTLGAEGTNTVVASPGLGGDAPEGVYFSPATRTFSATANPPSALAFVQQPSSATAGAPVTAQVEVRDRNGERVFGYDGPVSVGIASGPAGGTLGGTNPVNAVDGLASFSLVLTRAGTYTLNASAPFLPGPADLPVSDGFTISAGAPAMMTIVQGNNVTAASGSVVSPAPTVLVVDAFGNAITGAGVEWTAALSSTSTASPGSTTTGANGQTSTTWTLGDGPNQLRAELTTNQAIFVVFDATGTSTLVDQNVCAPGGAKDALNDPARPYAFYLPDPGNGRTMRQISLYFSSQGRANQPTEYEIELTTQRATFDPAVSIPVATRARVNLRGNNAEDKLATFTLTQPIVGASGAAARAVMVRLRVLDNPDGATITFNAGQCSPGAKNCKVPPACKVTEVSSPLPYPVGTFYRNSVAIRVKGN